MVSFVEVNRAANTTARTALGGAGGGALPRRTARKATSCSGSRQVDEVAYRLHAAEDHATEQQMSMQ
jgi:hypothetical protein